MSIRFSFNIGGFNINQSEWDRILQWGIENKPSMTIIMDDRNKARIWKERVGDVIYRTYDSQDNEYHAYNTPKQAAERLARDHADAKDIWHYYRLNEASSGNTTEGWHKLQAWLIDFGKEAKARGFKVTTCGLALGKNWVTPEWVMEGHVDDLLRYAAANTDSFLLDTHEYVTGTTWSPQIPNYPSSLFDRDKTMLFESVPVDVETFIDSRKGFPNWGLFRSNWAFNTRARVLGLGALPYVITESILDFNDHIQRGGHTYGYLPDGTRVLMESELRKFKMPQYDYLRGVLGHRLWVAWLLTGKMDANAITTEQYMDFYVRNLQFGEKWYPENCKGIMLFALNNNWRELPGNNGHDHIPFMSVLLPKMKVLAMTTPLPTPAPPVTVPKRIRAKVDALRIRKTPMLTGDVLGYLPRVYSNVRYALTTVDSTTDSYKWRYIEITLPDSDNVVSGYVADSLIEVEPDAIELTALEKDLILAFRADDTDAILAILNNPQLVIVSEREAALLAAYRLKDIKALLHWVSDLIP